MYHLLKEFGTTPLYRRNMDVLESVVDHTEAVKLEKRLCVWYDRMRVFDAVGGGELAHRARRLAEMKGDAAFRQHLQHFFDEPAPQLAVGVWLLRLDCEAGVGQQHALGDPPHKHRRFGLHLIRRAVAVRWK